MPLIVTPTQLQRRSEFYLQLASLTSAGLPIIQALETVLRSPPSRAIGRRIHLLTAALAQGSTFTEALRRLDPDMPAFDNALIHAGEKSGRLDICLKLLGNYYATRAKLLRSLLSDLAYPAFLLHFAVFIFPFPEFFQTWNVAVYAGKVLASLLPIYAVVLALCWASQSTRAEGWRSFVERALRWVPVLGKARQCLTMARFSAALDALLNAGVLMIESLVLAADASGSPALRRAVASWVPRLNNGATPSELFRSNSLFPETFSSLYNAGEVAGKLHETLPRIHIYFEEEASRRFHALSKWVPKIIYLAIMLRIVVRIVSFYQGYFSELDKIM